MNITKIAAAGVAGTTAMTLYSYALSALKDKNFKEPGLLGKLLFRMGPVVKKGNANVMGWLLHYFVGILFALAYKVLLGKRKINHPAKTGFIIGAASGIVAVIVWKTSFHLHPSPPLIDYKRYYGQLVIAHIIFGVVTMLVLEKKEQNTVMCKHRQLKNESN